MTFAAQLEASLGDAFEKLTEDDIAGIETLQALSPLYGRLILQRPEYVQVLIDLESIGFKFTDSTWDKIFLHLSEKQKSSDLLNTTRQLRRLGALSIAYAEVTQKIDCPQALRAISSLAIWCVQKITAHLFEKWSTRLGHPMQGSENIPYCIFALGKLGGGELNFCSDIDLIYTYKSDGICIKEGKDTRILASVFYQRFFQDLTTALQERSDEGFLYNVDLRLRPHGDASAIAHPVHYLEKHYAKEGQVWERLAWMRAEPIAGNLSFGLEFLEEINTFRYPRYFPESMLGEISALKLRIEAKNQETKKTGLDIKNGRGGIREIEFIIQSLQLLNGGKNPFLQTPSTLVAITHFSRYEVLPKEKLNLLAEAYLFFRKIENRLQMYGEQQTHTLPQAGDSLRCIACNLGFSEDKDFLAQLRTFQDAVHELYTSILGAQDETYDWTAFFENNTASDRVEASLQSWFPHTEDKRFLSALVRGERGAFYQENVRLFVQISSVFQRLMPKIAHPEILFHRLGAFAASYGGLNAFLRTCALNPQIFEVLSLLFDRSEYIWSLLKRQPEIVEELLLCVRIPIGKTHSKSTWQEDIQKHMSSGGGQLALYIQSEQLRLNIQELMGFNSLEHTEAQLAELAKTLIACSLKRIDPDQHLGVVALGKLGTGKLSLGSDLDLLFVSENPERALTKAEALIKTLEKSGTFKVDTRLRPYGQDGAMVSNISTLLDYYQKNAQLWEHQALTKSDWLFGSSALAERFSEMIDAVIYAARPIADVKNAVWQMRLTIERGKSKENTVDHFLKTQSGGLWDIEFLVQAYQLSLGREHKILRSGDIISVLKAIHDLGYLDENQLSMLSEHYLLLKKLEFYSRRYPGGSAHKLEELAALWPYWLGYEKPKEYLAFLEKSYKACRSCIEKVMTSDY